MKLPPVLAFLWIGIPMAAWASNSGCLCTYGQSCWPSASTFAQLQSQMSQPLIHVPSPNGVTVLPPLESFRRLHRGRQNWYDGNWRSSLPRSMRAPRWKTFTFQNGTAAACYLNTTITGMCEQGSVPVIGVDARIVEDVQAAVTFAMKHNLKLVVKNTGHDFLGCSVAKGAFVVWTHNMKNVMYNSTFSPQGSPADETKWHEAYAAANNYSRLMVGGFSIDGSVGSACGWLAGEGHSALSLNFGIGVDNALEISVVLSTGEFLTTNKYQSSDLFWALRGGGGSTYGIVASVATAPTPKSQLSSICIRQTLGIPRCCANSWAVYCSTNLNLQMTVGGGYGSISDQQLYFYYFGPNITNETAIATTQAWHNYSLSLAPFDQVSIRHLD